MIVTVHLVVLQDQEPLILLTSHRLLKEQSQLISLPTRAQDAAGNNNSAATTIFAHF